MGTYLADLPIPDEPVKNEEAIFEVVNWGPTTPMQLASHNNMGYQLATPRLQQYVDDNLHRFAARGIYVHTYTLMSDRVYLVSSKGYFIDLEEALAVLLGP